MDGVNVAQALVDVTDRNERDTVVNEEGNGSESGGLLSTVLSSGRAAPVKNAH